MPVLRSLPAVWLCRHTWPWSTAPDGLADELLDVSGLGRGDLQMIPAYAGMTGGIPHLESRRRAPTTASGASPSIQ